ncbi:hypothetical protein AYI70_g529 [Smittium culicis]|uniref:Uncharacterized protein n=1 Tax=Smittium culicis TaxID=133412 RepID=A0A1R1YGX8_9FUNG|nr:hypothetical protein AYI70_g529 [Smittium culicis]
MFDRRWDVWNEPIRIFYNVLKAQFQVRIHCLKVNPVAFFADFPIHRPSVDDRPIIPSFPVDYRDDSLTVWILGAKFFDPPGAPGHPGGHPSFHRCLDECCQHIRPSRIDVGSVYSLPDLVLDRPRYIPLAIHNITQVGVLVSGVDFLALQSHTSIQLTAHSHYPALEGIHGHFPSVRSFGNGVQCGL